MLRWRYAVCGISCANPTLSSVPDLHFSPNNQISFVFLLLYDAPPDGSDAFLFTARAAFSWNRPLPS